MATRKTKFRISIEKLQIEFEGDQEQGQQIQQGVQHAIGGLMNAQARLLTMQSQPGPIIDGEVVATEGHPAQAGTDGNGDKQKPSRQRRSKGGPTVADLLTGLKQEGYSLQPRTGVEVQGRLKDKGHNPRQSSVLTGLQRLAQKDELYREYNSENVYVYKDTPFHEGSRSPSSANQTVE